MDQPLLNHDTVISYHPTGSRYICNPAPMDTDEDWVVLVKEDGRDAFTKHLTSNGFWRSHQNYFSGSDFQSWRPIDDPSTNEDKRNFIVTYDPEWYQLFVEATWIAKEENLLRKEDRIALFDMIQAKVRKKEERRYQKLKEQAEKNQQDYYQSITSSKTLNKFYPRVSTATTQTFWINLVG